MESQSTTTVVVKNEGPGCLVSLIWFLLVGWWASAIWMSVAWVLVVLIITMPIGLKMINFVPRIVSLREPTREFTTVTDGLSTRVTVSDLPQQHFLVRALYFIFIGWWFSAIWMSVAWFIGITVIGLPLAIWMYNRIPAVTTLKRY